MFDFSQEQLQEILELQPSQDRPDASYREGFAEAQQLIHRVLSGEPEAIPSRNIELALEKSLSEEISAEPEPAVGMKVRTKQGSQQTGLIDSVGLTSVSVGLSDQGWTQVYHLTNFWKMFELVDPTDELMRKAREISEELTRVIAAIDQLSVAHSNFKSEVKFDKSKLYRGLEARRLKLLSQLVVLG